MADREGRTDRFGRPVTIQPPTTPNTMRRQGEDINDFLPDWITGNEWYQGQYDKARERDRLNQGTPKEDRKFMLFEWIKSIINNPNVSSTQASQILNDAGVMAKDLMLAMNPLGTAYAGEGQAQEMTSIPSYDQKRYPISPIVNPQHTGPEVADPGGEIAVGPHRNIPQPTIPDTESFAPRIPEPTTAMYGSNVRASQMSAGLQKERDFGEFYNMPSTPPVSSMGFEDVKRDSQRRASVPAPMPQPTGLLPPSRPSFPNTGPPGRSYSQGKSTRQPRRFGPH